MTSAREWDEAQISFIEGMLEGVEEQATEFRHYLNGESVSFKNELNQAFRTRLAHTLILVNMALSRMNSSNVRKRVMDYLPEVEEAEYTDREFGQREIHRIYEELFSGRFDEDYVDYETKRRSA